MPPDRPIRPVLFITINARDGENEVRLNVLVPNNILPADLYNALYANMNLERFGYGWITNRGRIITQEEAARIALEDGLIDKKVDKLTIKEYQGMWKHKDFS